MADLVSIPSAGGSASVTADTSKTEIGAGSHGTAGTDSVSVGEDAVASGAQSVSVGFSASSSGTNAVAIGAASVATGNSSTAVGYNARAPDGGIVIGAGNTNGNGNCVIVGALTANGSGQLMLGGLTTTMRVVGGNQNQEYGMKLVQASATTSTGTTYTLATIPANSQLMNVTLRVNTTISGPTSVTVGVSGDLARFGTLSALTSGTTHYANIAPASYAAATDILLTAVGGNFSAGEVRCFAMANYLTAPDS